MKDILYNAGYLCIGYPIGIIVSFGIWILRLTGRIRVIGIENAREAMRLHTEKGKAVAMLCNHPVAWEVFFAPSIATFPNLIFHPFRDFPWCTPKGSLMKFLFFIYFMRAIPADRVHPKRIVEFINTVADKLHKKGENVMIFPEAGRTGSRLHEVKEVNGKKMRRLKSGYHKILTKGDPNKIVALPMWIEFGTFSMARAIFRKATLIIGKPEMDVASLTPEVLEQKLFALANPLS